ncbi:MAG: hypothetical protein HXY18_17430 [Bryobacteraceae bacterium]|nr:hypothetical protein [Bryobacteraceae bacterium]
MRGRPVAVKKLTAGGQFLELEFSVRLAKSSWMAVRILASSHTSPVFALVDGKPVRASRASAEWCLNAVNQCWMQKSAQIRAGEKKEARRAYEHARDVSRRLMGECEERTGPPNALAEALRESEVSARVVDLGVE